MAKNTLSKDEYGCFGACLLSVFLLPLAPFILGGYGLYYLLKKKGVYANCSPEEYVRLLQNRYANSEMSISAPYDMPKTYRENAKRYRRYRRNTLLIGLVISAFLAFFAAAQEETASDVGSVFVGGMIIAGGFTLFFHYRAKKLDDLADRYARYVILIGTQDEVYLRTLAMEFPLALRAVIADILRMLALGYWPGAKVDAKELRLYFPGVGEKRSGEKTVEICRVQCANCGAWQDVPADGTSRACEYCGSRISSNEG